ncbi:hypothetical protein S7711_11337 [Stachybotrys chartarum IBT 7711]|uniref:Uncharacterized protein n=1 Tax=Stachybotrys chartarum (strain CBS 109288 / IBT 7711) TaxID=1280523 RepID=A0A084AYJ1_STACB|nr:hypothetical protein S7711_11337 [Stachybotrys chartarum IBT 7711]KFA47698.1 hypothetical protein S40293_11287 [Stachybotrys chartarum IBT 40293]KFA77699.1 hypothetical protein S40288_10743 [Stachybotrys chartarum IBT 40288]
MRFSVFATLAALAGTALGAAIRVEQRQSLINKIGGLVAGIEDDLGVTELEATLDELLGNGLTQLEDALGVSFALYLLGLSEEGAEPGTIQAIGEAVAMIEAGTPVPEVNEYLDRATGGAIVSIEDALGVTDILVALGLEEA